MLVHVLPTVTRGRADGSAVAAAYLDGEADHLQSPAGNLLLQVEVFGDHHALGEQGPVERVGVPVVGSHRPRAAGTDGVDAEQFHAPVEDSVGHVGRQPGVAEVRLAVVEPGAPPSPDQQDVAGADAAGRRRGVRLRRQGNLPGNLPFEVEDDPRPGEPLEGEFVDGRPAGTKCRGASTWVPTCVAAP
jgi:hypothetical protein